MKRQHLLMLFIILGIACSAFGATTRPRVIITTDINNGPGDPDDRQSLCHLLFYANELDIRGIIPDRFSRTGTEAFTIAFDLYEKDYNNPKTKYKASLPTSFGRQEADTLCQFRGSW